MDFVFYPDWQARMAEVDAGLYEIDHLTHNVQRGNMDVWSNFYERIGNFREIRYFDIEGKLTGLHSRAMTAPAAKFAFPSTNLPTTSPRSRSICVSTRGGIQHIAMASSDIYRTIRTLRGSGTGFMPTPDTYYEKVDSRVEGHQEDLAALKELRILIDGSPPRTAFCCRSSPTP